MNRINLKNGLTLFTAFWICVSLAFGHSGPSDALYHDSPPSKTERQALAAHEASKTENGYINNLKYSEQSDLLTALVVREYLEILGNLETGRLKGNNYPTEMKYNKEINLMKNLRKAEGLLKPRDRIVVLKRLREGLVKQGFSADLSDLNKASHIYGAIKRLQGAE